MLQKLMKIGTSIAGRYRASAQGNSDYVDLAPTDKADRSGIYSDVLLQATKNPNVYNIALTGPYGSGKSSIIKTFLKRYRKYWFFKKPVLQISLAAFLPEADAPRGKVTKQEIERSILQQMLYGADANSLPLSRFKRIRSPKWWSCFVWPLVIVGMLACWKLIDQRDAILDLSFFQPLDETNWFNLSCFTFGMLFVWLVLHQIYVKSLGISLRSISLKDIEIKPYATDQESILNRHLDEIIYFFQSTNYDLVVIEDLDRFDNSEIFVTLREINSLVNANAGVKRQIRFLYALRDNMFVNTDRTKFFEFIIPVIPIINSSNSIDKMIEQEERLSLPNRLDRQFLKEVSRYLNDLRLIQNIFNEYVIYRKNLVPTLDPNRLLAVLIYKNVLPSDFEELHQEKGKLATILRKHGELIAKAEDRYRSQISELEQRIINAEKQVPTDLEELRKIYAATLIAHMPGGFPLIDLNGRRVNVQERIWENDGFDEIFKNQKLACYTHQGHQRLIDIVALQNEINPDKTYKERKTDIEDRSDAFKDSALKKITELRAESSAFRMRKFNEVIRAGTKGAAEVFDEFGENKELVKFLVFEGFLDDTYYQYTSLFHSGRLSPNDNRFLVQIRAFNNPEPDFQIDNPKEVIDEMRKDDFRRHFVLNVILVDCMLSNPNQYALQIADLVVFVSSSFDECSDFFEIYYERGKCVAELTSRLLEKWPGFVSAVLESSDSSVHVARLIAHLPEKHLRSLHQKEDQIAEFLSTNLSEVLGQGIDFDLERLKMLTFETQDLKTIQPYPAIARLLTDEGLYKLSIPNIEFIFRDVLGFSSADELEIKHYSTVLKSGNNVLINKIEDEFQHYLKSILLALKNNTEEDVSTILKILKHEEIESEHVESFLEMQSARLPSLEGVPSQFHKTLFRLRNIEISWENCLEFVSSESFDAQTLTTFLQEDEIEAKLSSVIISNDKSTVPLTLFLINNNELEEDIYRDYIRTIPIQFIQFPADIDPEKWLILIEEEKIAFSESAFAHLADYPEYQVLFIAKNIDGYLKSKDQFSLDDDFREKLLNSDIADDQKLKIIADMDMTMIAGLPSRAAVIGKLFNSTNADISHLTAEAAQAVIVNVKPVSVQVSLFNKCHELLSDEQVRETLRKMPDPFPEFKPGWRQPTIPNTDLNVRLVEWLVAREIISSWKETYFGDDIRVYNFRR